MAENRRIPLEDIRFYNFAFQLLHIEHRYISANWTLYYNDVGTFEAHFDLQNPVVGLLIKEPYVVAVQGDKTAIITGRQLGEDFSVYGRTCNWILQKRTAADFSYNATAEEIARELVAGAFSDVSNFVLGEISGQTQSLTDFARTGPTVLGDTVQDVLALSLAGHTVKYDVLQKKWVFRVFCGRELLLTISEANRNAYETQYSEDFLDHITEGIYEKTLEAPAGGGEKPDPVWETLVAQPKEGIFRWVGILSGKNQSEAQSDLLKKKLNREILTKTKNLCFGKDYNLGDIVTLQVQKGSFQAAQKQRITGVNLWYENNEIGQEPILEEYNEEEL